MPHASDPDAREAIRVRADGAEGDVVVVDAGVFAGWGMRTVEFRWDTTDVATRAEGEFGYRADLAGRPYGSGDAAPWEPLVTRTGTVRAGDVVELRFEDIEFEEPISRLRLTIAVRPVSWARGGTTRRVAAGLAE